MAHVSFVPDPENPVPVVLPMIARIGQYPGDSEPHAYIHGYVTIRLLKQPAGSGDGFPVCICATKVDGLILALAPFDHSYQYRSAVLHGKAKLVDPETEENVWAMKLITDGVCPDRWDNSRNPPESSEITSTRILKVRIDSASAKINDGGVKSSKKDLSNPEVADRVWTGIIPVYEVLGKPVSAETNKVPDVPAYIENYRKDFNQRAERGEGENKSQGLLGRLTGGFW